MTLTHVPLKIQEFIGKNKTIFILLFDFKDGLKVT